MIDELLNRISDAVILLRSNGYEPHRLLVNQLIRECNDALPKNDSRGAWESELVQAATNAFNAGHLMLALVSIEKALQVSQLSEQEYQYGYNYGRRT